MTDTPDVVLKDDPAHPLAAHRHLDMLDGVRGLAVLLVMVFHSLAYFSPLGAIAPFWKNGEFGVEIFFGLSGYVLTVAYARSVPRDGYLRFFKRRIARLVPMHLVAFALALSLFIWWKLEPHIGLHKTKEPVFFNKHQVIPQLTLTQSLGTGGTPDKRVLAWNYPSWSLSAELWASLALGLLFFLSLRMRQLALGAILLLSLVLLWRTGYGPHDYATGRIGLVWHYSIWRAAAPIAAGALAATIPERIRVPWWASAVALLVTPIGIWGLHHDRWELWWSVLSGLLVFLVARSSGPAITFLSTGIVREVGKRSYSIYILHAVVLTFIGITATALSRTWELRVLTGVGGFVTFALYVVVVYVISGVTARLVEGKVQTWLRRVLRAQ